MSLCMEVWADNLLVRSFICNMKRPSVMQSIKLQVSSKFSRQTFFCQWTPCLLARLVLGRQTFLWPMPPPTTETSTWQTNLLWQMDPPTSKTSTWQMNLLWLMDPPSIENRCLQYQYTILGR